MADQAILMLSAFAKLDNKQKQTLVLGGLAAAGIGMLYYLSSQTEGSPYSLETRNKPAIYEKYYSEVPQQEVEKLIQFRNTHTPKKVILNGKNWWYDVSKTINPNLETIIFLPGGTRLGEAFFPWITELEKIGFNSIAVTYPYIDNIQDAVNGICTIMDTEKIPQATILGHSGGGMIAQCFLRVYPNRVKNIILSHTSAPVQEFKSRYAQSPKLWLAHSVPWFVFKTSVMTKVNRNLEPLTQKNQHEKRIFWQAFYREGLETRTTQSELIGFTYGLLQDFFSNRVFKPSDIELLNWRGRILILQSSNDKDFSEEEQKALKSVYLNAEVVTFHDGHLSLVNDEAHAIDIVTKFLTRQT